MKRLSRRPNRTLESRQRQRRRRGLRLETLETRNLLATFSVISTADAGPGSLRDAILLANGAPTDDTIDFDIPGTGAQTSHPY